MLRYDGASAIWVTPPPGEHPARFGGISSGWAASAPLP